jgi:signal transduction histidine kinase
MEIFISFMLVFLFSGCFDSVQKSDIPTVQKGVLDITRWDFKQKEAIPLNGDWEFYWNQLIAPNESPENLVQKRTGYFKPGVRWSGNSVNNTALNGIGFATYRATLQFPESGIGLSYGLKFDTTGGAAYKIFIDELLVAEFGKVGTSYDAMTPTRKPDTILFILKHTKPELLVQISNFHHVDGSFWYAPEIGLSDQIHFQSKRKKAMEALLFGSIFIIALYHLSIYAYRKKDKSSLFFTLFSLTISVYIISINDPIIYYFFPDLSYTLAYRLLFIFYLGIPCYLSFLYILFPLDFSLKIIRIFWVIYSLGYCFLLFSPNEIGSLTERPFIFIVIFSFIYAFWGVLKAILSKRPDSQLIFIPILIFVFSVINDILTIYSYIHTPTTFSYAIFLFIIAQSIFLSRRFANAFMDVENLSNELKIINESLEVTVELRTFQLKNEKQKAEDANHWKDKFIILVSHDLRSPLSSIHNLLTLIEEDHHLSRKDQMGLIKQSKIILLNAISNVKHLLNLSRFNSETAIIDYSDFDVHRIATDLVESFHIELERKKIKLQNLIPVDTIITADENIVVEIIRNLILNAIKFSKENGKIRLEYKENSNLQTILISDNGIGISDLIKRNLFHTEISTNGTFDEKGFGVGLKLCYELMNLHNGSIDVDSVDGLGSKFSLNFPSNKNTILIAWKRDLSNPLKELLEDKTNLCIQTKSIAEALNILKNISFKTFVVDSSFSEEEKTELTNGIYNEYLYDDRKIVFI